MLIIGALLERLRVPPWLAWAPDVEGGSTSMLDADTWLMLTKLYSVFGYVVCTL